MQQQQPGTVTHSRISSLLISRRLTRARVASRYSVASSPGPTHILSRTKKQMVRLVLGMYKLSKLF